MDQLERDELKNSLESLLSTLQCPVCLSLLATDSLLCVNGHAICKKCQPIPVTSLQPYGQASNSPTCPKCRSSFSNLQKNTVFSQLLEFLPHLCRFERCSYLVKARDNHEAFCRFRPMVCKFQGCTWVGSVENIHFHVEDKHPQKKIFTGTKHMMKILRSDVDEKRVFLYSSGGHYFWKQIIKYDSNVGFHFTPVFVGQPSCDVYMRIWFQSDEREYDAGMKFKMNQNNAEGDRLYFPARIVLDFLNENELKYDLMITEVRNDAIKLLIE